MHRHQSVCVFFIYFSIIIHRDRTLKRGLDSSRVIQKRCIAVNVRTDTPTA